MPKPMQVRWRAQPDNVIGGWCCTFPESDERTPADGAQQVCDFVGEIEARHVANLHNKWLFELSEREQTMVNTGQQLWCFLDDCPAYICNGPHREVKTSLGIEALRDDQTPAGTPINSEKENNNGI